MATIRLLLDLNENFGGCHVDTVLVAVSTWCDMVNTPLSNLKDFCEHARDHIVKNHPHILDSPYYSTVMDDMPDIGLWVCRILNKKIPTNICFASCFLQTESLIIVELQSLNISENQHAFRDKRRKSTSSPR